ncbi:DUF4192 family protein [Microbacterium bovistercoris]|uniref:DUF4192 family protein n=1 Tax=Microbacterium bovistercoris TaxID=2293570 RepID=A0A371NXJ8_9MICO|nr:DUF4192 family protein [Microbacterium bovistercoris]REJ07471.1 DUF4192 family protein [Microbacterium bovistercoris]
MDTIIRASDAAELLSLVPALAGFTPVRSLVLLPFHGTRAPGVLRMDLPPGDDAVCDYVDEVLDLLAQVRGCDAIAVVVYSDEDAIHTRDGLVLPHALLIDHLLGSAHDVGFHIIEGLCVLPSGWSDYLEQEPVLHPLGEIPRVPDLPGVDVSADQRTGTELPPADLAARQRVGMALRDLDAVLERLRCGGAQLGSEENPQAIGAAVMLDDIPAFAEMLLEGDDDPPPFACAALLWCLHRPALRDAVLVQWASDHATGMRAFDAQLGHARRGDPTPADVGDIFLGRAGDPDPARLRRALEVARYAVACAPRDLRPDVLASAGWLSWALGRSTHADAYLRMSQQIDPEHGLTGLLLRVLESALLPTWLMERGERLATQVGR